MTVTISARPGRLAVAALILAATAALIAVDLATSDPINPFAAPPPLAFGSGQSGGGAHCATPVR
ncbi:MAG: hypothetical protein EA355_13430 [Rhodobacteraceae bacterium]|nr:MAG: hypothetical protein EA355_13430 [Paracoccaceae bacterium]